MSSVLSSKWFVNKFYVEKALLDASGTEHSTCSFIEFESVDSSSGEINVKGTGIHNGKSMSHSVKLNTKTYGEFAFDFVPPIPGMAIQISIKIKV